MRPLYFAIIILIIIVIIVTMLFSFLRGGQEQLKKEQEPAKLPLSSEEIKKQESPTLPIIAIEEIKEKNIEELPALSLIQIANEPISGFKSLKNGLSRYIDKATGHIFEASLVNGGKELISNTTLPKIFEVKWSEDGKKDLFKYLEGEEAKIVSAEFSGTSTKHFIFRICRRFRQYFLSDSNRL